MCIFVLKIKMFLNRYFRDGNQYVIKHKQALCFFLETLAVTLPIVIFSHIKYGTDDALFIIASIGSKYDFG